MNITKNNNNPLFFLITQLILCLVLLAWNGAYLLLVLFCFYCFYKCDILSYCHIKDFFEFLKSVLLFIPVLFFTLYISNLLLHGYSEQNVVQQVKFFVITKNLREIISICLISPILEELFFRFIFYNTLKYFFGIYLAVLFASLIFAFVHTNILSFPTLFLLGVFFNYVFIRFSNLLYPILLHVVFNTVMLTIIMNK